MTGDYSFHGHKTKKVRYVTITEDKARSVTPVLKLIIERTDDRRLKLIAASLKKELEGIEDFRQCGLTPSEEKLLKDVEESFPEGGMEEGYQYSFVPVSRSKRESKPEVVETPPMQGSRRLMKTSKPTVMFFSQAEAKHLIPILDLITDKAPTNSALRHMATRCRVELKGIKDMKECHFTKREVEFLQDLKKDFDQVPDADAKQTSFLPKPVSVTFVNTKLAFPTPVSEWGEGKAVVRE